MEDEAIRTLVSRLARPHASGGTVIERAAILAEGTDSAEILTWIADHHGEPEEAVAPRAAGRGLHSARAEQGRRPGPPRRYVLPRDALG